MGDYAYNDLFQTYFVKRGKINDTLGVHNFWYHTGHNGVPARIKLRTSCTVSKYIRNG